MGLYGHLREPIKKLYYKGDPAVSEILSYRHRMYVFTLDLNILASREGDGVLSGSESCQDENSLSTSPDKVNFFAIDLSLVNLVLFINEF